MTATGKRIDSLRKARGLSVKDLMIAVGVGSPQAIYKWLKGTSLPSVDNLVMLSDIFDLEIDEILVVTRAG